MNASFSEYARLESQFLVEEFCSVACFITFLNLDDSLYRVYTNGNVRVGVYVAYWTPGKVSYR